MHLVLCATFVHASGIACFHNIPYPTCLLSSICVFQAVVESSKIALLVRFMLVLIHS